MSAYKTQKNVGEIRAFESDERPHWARAVKWKDLVAVNRIEVVHELLISLPWLIASLLAARHGWLIAALGCSFMFFLTGLRQVHNAYHYALGLSRLSTDLVMLVMSVLMLGSMHAVQFNHLCHHAHCMKAEDLEAASADMPWWKAILVGPLFPWRLLRKAIRVGDTRLRAWIIAELLANVVWIGLVFGVLDIAELKYHVVAMALGQCLTSFFAVWTVHHDARHAPAMSRTIRGKIRSRVTYNMFFHMEHHLFPRVPTCHLGQLANRIDAVKQESRLEMVI
jgi:fatty acid desaturase